ALDFGQVLVGGHGDANAAHHWFDDHFRHRLRSLAEDRRLHRLDAGEPTTRVAQAEWAAIAIGRRHMRKVAGIRLELCLPLAHAACIPRGERRAARGVMAAVRLEAEDARALVLWGSA